MSFEPGVALEDDAQWQAPAYCFPDDDDGEGVGDGLEAAVRILRELAGAAATS